MVKGVVFGGPKHEINRYIDEYKYLYKLSEDQKKTFISNLAYRADSYSKEGHLHAAKSIFSEMVLHDTLKQYPSEELLKKCEQEMAYKYRAKKEIFEKSSQSKQTQVTNQLFKEVEALEIKSDYLSALECLGQILNLQPTNEQAKMKTRSTNWDMFRFDEYWSCNNCACGNFDIDDDICLRCKLPKH